MWVSAFQLLNVVGGVFSQCGVFRSAFIEYKGAENVGLKFSWSELGDHAATQRRSPPRPSLININKYYHQNCI